MRRSFSKTKADRFPILLDLVEDNVRSRLIFPLVALSMYVLLVFTLYGDLVEVWIHFEKIYLSLSKKNNAPDQISPQIPLAQYYRLSNPFKETFPIPQVKASNKDVNLYVGMIIIINK